ncbi:MAG: DUF3368 domain-containing protein [Calditrichaeota bacterium]|nr:MAG: DUF3368 domain-containing protein [Calditrichota bacterium]
MPEKKEIVINTGPLLSLIAATGNLLILRELNYEVWVPYEVVQEMEMGGQSGFGLSQFHAATWLKKTSSSTPISPFLANVLDRGEASVIQLALDKHIPTVCIDETVGRRIARLSNLQVTGSIGILVRAKKEGILPSLKEALKKLEDHGIWVSATVITAALREAGEEL